MVRFKNRYITAEIEPNSTREITFNERDIVLSILAKVKSLFGVFGYAAIHPGLRIKYYNNETRVVIIRARHSCHLMLTSAIPLVTTIAGLGVTLNILYVGATIKHCYKVIVDKQRLKLAQLWPLISQEEKFSEIKEKLMDVGEILTFETEKMNLHKQ